MQPGLLVCTTGGPPETLRTASPSLFLQFQQIVKHLAGFSVVTETWQVTSCAGWKHIENMQKALPIALTGVLVGKAVAQKWCRLQQIPGSISRFYIERLYPGYLMLGQHI